jgi:hypothetical protein
VRRRDDVVVRAGQRCGGLGEQHVERPVRVHPGLDHVRPVVGALAVHPGLGHRVQHRHAGRVDALGVRVGDQAPRMLDPLAEDVGRGGVLAGQRHDRPGAHHPQAAPPRAV